MTTAISQSQHITASTVQNAFQEKSFLRSIVDSVCKFFTGHVSESSLEKLAVQKTLNDAIISSVRQQSQNASGLGNGNQNRESLELSVGGTKITIADDLRFGVSIRIDGERDAITIPTDLRVQDLINNAMMTNGGGEINTNSVEKQIGNIDLDLIAQESLKRYQENGILALQENEQDVDALPLFGTANGNVHLGRVITIDSDEMPATLKQMQDQAAKMKGDSKDDHVMLAVFGVRKLQSKLLDSNHYITAAVSSNPNTQPIIVDSKDFAKYPEGIKVLRSGHQATLDAVSCGSHALRAMNGLAIQLVGNKEFSQLAPPPAFNADISNESIDVNKMVNDIKAERIREIQNIGPVADDAAISFEDDD